MKDALSVCKQVCIIQTSSINSLSGFSIHEKNIKKYLDVLLIQIHRTMQFSINNNPDPQLVAQLKRYVYGIIGCCQNVHNGMGPFLNEYMYQDAMQIELQAQGIPFEKEFFFTATYRNIPIKHPHKMDFLIKKNVILECKAVEQLDTIHRQQLWNYMRLSGIKVGVLFNFAPVKSQCEKYFYNPEVQTISAF